MSDRESITVALGAFENAAWDARDILACVWDDGYEAAVQEAVKRFTAGDTEGLLAAAFLYIPSWNGNPYRPAEEATE